MKFLKQVKQNGPLLLMTLLHTFTAAAPGVEGAVSFFYG